MQDEDKTQEQLITQLHELRKRVAESEKEKGASTDAVGSLRRAEERLGTGRKETDQCETNDTERLYQQLVVRQNELEMQNEELRNALVQIEGARMGGCDSGHGQQALSPPVAEVRPQVNGIIQKRSLKEGSDVKAGELLYQIDPAPFQVAYDSARASLGKAQPNLPAVRSRAERYKELLSTKP